MISMLLIILGALGSLVVIALIVGVILFMMSRGEGDERPPE